ncbi:hypothetical protein C8R48DRAFT_678421 [Suillus tomentosus]|nr:hypothetical protein C8R48DRAFT_678421 [Suillus tomentosus]
MLICSNGAKPGPWCAGAIMIHDGCSDFGSEPIKAPSWNGAIYSYYILGATVYFVKSLPNSVHPVNNDGHDETLHHDHEWGSFGSFTLKAKKTHDMEYSTADIAAARSLQLTTIYDYACLLHEEKCLVLDNAELGFFILRTYVLWNNNRILLAVMLYAFSTFIGASTGLTFATTAPATYPTSAIPGITGCYQSSTTFRFFIPFLLFSVFDLGVLLSSRNPHAHMRHTQLANKPKSSHIMHAVFCSRWRTYSHHCFSIFQFMILATLATRMHLHLWQTNQHSHSSSALSEAWTVQDDWLSKILQQRVLLANGYYEPD